MTSLTFRCVSVSRALAAGTAHQARRHTHFGSHEALNHLFSAASPAACAGAVGRSPQWQPLSTHDWRNPARCAGVSAHRGTRGVLCATRAHPQVPPLRRVRQAVTPTVTLDAAAAAHAAVASLGQTLPSRTCHAHHGRLARTLRSCPLSLLRRGLRRARPPRPPLAAQGPPCSAP